MKELDSIQKRIEQIIGVTVASCALSYASHATGILQLDSSGYLRSSEDRGNGSSTLILGPKANLQSRWIDSAIDLRAYSYLEKPSLTLESKELYLATSRSFSPLHQITLGRRLHDWSIVDTHWKTGLWTPRFNWDPLLPEAVGNTGAFYSYQSRYWRVTAFASPIRVPERGYPIEATPDGQLTSHSPFWVPLPQRARLLNQDVPIRYSLDYPSMQSILLKPNSALSLRYGDKEGIWASANYGFMPIHQSEVAVEATLETQSMVVQTRLHPLFNMHHLLTTELGYQTDLFSLWASGTRDAPINENSNSAWVRSAPRNATIASAGTEFRLQNLGALNASYLRIDEDEKESNSSQGFEIDLPSRYNFSNAWKLGASFGEVQSPLNSQVSYTFDTGSLSGLLSVDFQFSPNKSKPKRTQWLLGIGTDWISSESGKGLIGQYRGDDRVRGRISYVF